MRQREKERTLKRPLRCKPKCGEGWTLYVFENLKKISQLQARGGILFL